MRTSSVLLFNYHTPSIELSLSRHWYAVLLTDNMLVTPAHWALHSLDNMIICSKLHLQSEQTDSTNDTSQTRTDHSSRRSRHTRRRAAAAGRSRRGRPRGRSGSHGVVVSSSPQRNSRSMSSSRAVGTGHGRSRRRGRSGSGVVKARAADDGAVQSARGRRGDLRLESGLERCREAVEPLWRGALAVVGCSAGCEGARGGECFGAGIRWQG